MDSASGRRLVTLFGYCLTACCFLTHEHAGCLCVVGGWVGCGPYSGRFTLLLLHPRTVLGVLLFVLAY